MQKSKGCFCPFRSGFHERETAWALVANSGGLGKFYSDKAEKVLKVKLQTAGQEEDSEKTLYWTYEGKLAEVFNFKRGMEMMRQENGHGKMLF